MNGKCQNQHPDEDWDPEVHGQLPPDVVHLPPDQAHLACEDHQVLQGEEQGWEG